MTGDLELSTRDPAGWGHGQFGHATHTGHRYGDSMAPAAAASLYTSTGDGGFLRVEDADTDEIGGRQRPKEEAKQEDKKTGRLHEVDVCGSTTYTMMLSSTTAVLHTWRMRSLEGFECDALRP